MKVFFEKIDSLRRERGMSVNGFSSLVNVNRATYWSWKKQNYTPTEKNIRKMAKVLNIAVSEISDLPDSAQLSANDLNEAIDSWNLLGKTAREQQKQEFSYINREILKLEVKLTQATTIINALLKSISTIFYIKDKNSRYITANYSFLCNLNLPADYDVTGKTDFDFFSHKEATINNEQDLKVINTGISLANIENHIPGSRKRKWGIISKYPILDTENRISGIVGTFVDISDRKQMEEIRRVLHILLETGPGFNVSVWKDGKTLFDFSEEKMLKFYSEEMKAKRKEQLDFLQNGIRHPNDVKIMNKEMNGKNITNDTYRDPFVITTKIYRFMSTKFGTRWVKAIKSGVNIGSSLYTIGCTFFYSKEKQNESNAMALMRLLNDFSKSTNTITWTAELTENKNFYFTFLSKNFEDATGFSIREFINVSPNLVTLRKHFQEIHNNENKLTPYDLIAKKFHKMIKNYINEKEVVDSNIVLLIKTKDQKILKIRTSVKLQKLSGTNRIFYGKSNFI